MTTDLGSNTWDARWQEDNTPWDLSGVTPALVAWRKGYGRKKEQILVPGCGRGHDAHFLSKSGASVTAVDFAPGALAAARQAYPDARVDWQQADVTALGWENRFHRVWEYTCFCALLPDVRKDYFGNLHKALMPGGVYWGMVFQEVPSPDNGPPFQIEPDAFRALLASFFHVEVFEEKTDRSIKARRGSEIWFEAVKA